MPYVENRRTILCASSRASVNIKQTVADYGTTLATVRTSYFLYILRKIVTTL
jgi:hypothetical protein